MKKFAICLLALAVAALFVPAAQAAPSPTKCYHLTNFCDGVQPTTINVGGIQGKEVALLWDFVCIGAGTGTLGSGGVNAFGSQPIYPFVGGTSFGFAANFKFKPAGHLFDLYGTFDGLTASVFQTNQPWTQTNGPCNPLVVKHGKANGLRPATVR